MATKHRPVAEAFPPGEFIREELEARGWTQKRLAEVLGRPFQTVNAVVNGRKSVTPRLARELEAALGASAEYWLNLENAYQLCRVGKPDPAIAARASALDASLNGAAGGLAAKAAKS
jgi:HTH-type transcriptional regulator/antitoxin HigA